MYERLEFSAKAHFSGPLVGAVVPFNAVHRSCTEDPQLDKAASRSSLTTSQLRDHVFDWRSDPWADVSHEVSIDSRNDASIDLATPSKLQQKFPRPVYLGAWPQMPPYPPFEVLLSFNSRRTLSYYPARTQSQSSVCNALDLEKPHGVRSNTAEVSQLYGILRNQAGKSSTLHIDGGIAMK